jgi:signal transduction histidine kinase/CheY-like chemotaxis protein
VLDRGFVLRDDEGAPLRMVGAMLDVSDRKAVERALTQEVVTTTAERDKAEEALRQSQKMEAVGQLTGGLAHDFNNLLTGISGALEMMQIRIAQGRVGEIDKYSVAAQGAVRRAAALTHRLLAFSRRQTLDPKPVDVNRLIFDIEELIRRTVGPQIEVETVGKAGIWTTLVDPNQLENALLNLCINARDAMPDGGRITIETANKWLDEAASRERDLDPGQYVSICVTDTGTGMTPEVISRAFDPFFTTKPMGEGTGLGLSMIYGFARQSGGHVRIYSELGMGTTMCIYLPRLFSSEGSDEGLANAAPVRGLREVGDQRIGVVLVVDDEPTVRMLVAEVAEEMGYTVLEAFDGPSAMRLLQGDAAIDLLITDVGLPGGMNGRQVADAALSLKPDLNILFITGYAENAVIGNGQLAPNMALLTKPFAMDALAQRIREIMP